MSGSQDKTVANQATGGQRLVILSSSPASAQFSHGLSLALDLVTQPDNGVVIFLLQDATLAARKGSRFLPQALFDHAIRLFVLDEDLALRGLGPQELYSGISPVSYDRLIEEMEVAEKVIGCL